MVLYKSLGTFVKSGAWEASVAGSGTVGVGGSVKAWTGAKHGPWGGVVFGLLQYS